jgi:hypothetical protein
MDEAREKRNRERIAEKCADCFRRDECMLFSSGHAGIQNCLGPFQDAEDWAMKIDEEHEKEEEAKRKERETGIRKFNRKRQIDDYRLNRMLCELLGMSGEQEDDD